MEARKLLYVTDLKEKSLSFNLLKGILPVHKLDFNEMTFLQTSSFNSWLKGLSDFSIKSKIILDDPLLPHGILNTAKKEGASLIVVNLDRKEGKTSKNSTIRQLIKGSSLPILFINNPDQEIKSDQKGIFAGVVFATDWSHPSERALSFLLDFKKILGELEIVHVIKGKLTIKEMRELKDRLMKTRKICLDNKIDAESHIYAGKTSEEILTAARDYKAAMVVVGGKSGKKGLSRFFKKSSSWKVVCETDLPVLVVP
ncbi:MAG: universal stress protein [Deltaproteobacteria bacterium]|nr:universal stress protein [Deltaproteobacteria bacterium]